MGKRKADKKKSTRNKQIEIRNDAEPIVYIIDARTLDDNSAVETRNKSVNMDAEIQASHLTFSFNHSGNSFKFCALVEAFTMKVSVKSAEITTPVHSSKPITTITVQEINVYENIAGKPSDINATLDVSQISFQMEDCYKSSKVTSKVHISKLKASIKAEEIGNSTSEGRKSSHRKRKSKINLSEIVTDIDDFEVNDRVSSTEAIKNDSHPSTNTDVNGMNDSLPDNSSDLVKCNLLYDNLSDLEKYNLLRDSSSDLEKCNLLRDNSGDLEKSNLPIDNSSDLDKCNIIHDNSSDSENSNLFLDISSDLEKCNLLRDNSSGFEKCNLLPDNSSDLVKCNLFQDYDFSEYEISNPDNFFENELFGDIENIWTLCCQLYFAILGLLVLILMVSFLTFIKA